MSEQNNGGIFGSASPKLTFIFGLVVGLAVVSFIGFLVLLFGNFRGGKESATVVNNQPIAQVQNPTPNDAQDAEPPVGNFRPVDVAKDHIRGDKNAAVTIIEYSDTECPFCKRFHVTMQDVMNTYGGKIRWVYRHFPLVQLHSKAPKEAEATECAYDQGGDDAFWKYVDRIYAITPSNDGLDLAELPKIATSIGLNKQKFETCLSSGKFTSKVQEDENDGITAGARGTPYSVIIAGDQKIPVSGALPTSELKQMLDSVVQ
ncbi:MAG: thioredoxin domain-containing protein [bacterium]|nr:thioredoxin domain-containing protein [bacterium]